MNKLVKSIDKADLYQEFLKSLNGILGLTNREIELLVFMITMEIANSKIPEKDQNVICSENRKQIHTSMKMGLDNLCRYLNKFKEKGIISKNKYGEYHINKALIPIVIGDRVQTTIILKLNKQ